MQASRQSSNRPAVLRYGLAASVSFSLWSGAPARSRRVTGPRGSRRRMPPGIAAAWSSAVPSAGWTRSGRRRRAPGRRGSRCRPPRRVSTCRGSSSKSHVVRPARSNASWRAGRGRCQASRGRGSQLRACSARQVRCALGERAGHGVPDPLRRSARRCGGMPLPASTSSSSTTRERHAQVGREPGRGRRRQPRRRVGEAPDDVVHRLREGLPSGSAEARGDLGPSRSPGTTLRRIAFGSVLISAVTRSSRRPGTCQSKPAGATRASSGSGMCTVTPSSSAPGSNR